MALSEEKLRSVGCKWMYTFNCLEAKKFIPAYISYWRQQWIPRSRDEGDS